MLHETSSIALVLTPFTAQRPAVTSVQTARDALDSTTSGTHILVMAPSNAAANTEHCFAGKAGILVGRRVATAYDEDALKGRRGYLCESGLLDPELDESVCDVYSDDEPSERQQLWAEAWSRG